MKKILFGAGLYGRMALREYGRENVAFFTDNNEALWGRKIEDVEVIAPKDILNHIADCEIIVTTKFKNKIIDQLKDMGIKRYAVYTGADHRYYPTNQLIVNPYENGTFLDNSQQAIEQKIKEIESEVEQLYGRNVLFDHVEIETVNRCNGNCSFCPVSKGNDSREYHVMSQELFESIIDQLAKINYSGRLALFSNNEPFLDEMIIDKHKYAREKLPNARMHLFTNGTLLTVEKFIEITKYLDELVIDNYQQELKLIRPCKEIVEYCKDHTELKEKVTIILRKPNEILSSRGGDAPNRQGDLASCSEAKCVLPYKQLIIRPDGRVSLCCNDPLGKNTLADLTKETLLEAWNNERFRTVREALYHGRMNWGHCKYCDAFNIG